MIRLEIKKLKYDIKREAAKISALSSEKIDKYESDQRGVIEQAKFLFLL